mgnify:CR=1 FL=1
MAKILLVEDEINIASFIERGLKEFGHSVTVCHDGDTGWKILQDKPFDLLILDIIMPKIKWFGALPTLSPNVRVSNPGNHADSFRNNRRHRQRTGCGSR